MIAKFKKDRIAAMIDALAKAAAGDYAKKIDVSPGNDELDLLAGAINTFLKKTGKRLIDQKQTRYRLKTSENRYKNILNNMQESYLEVDLKGNFVFFNDALSQMLGYSRSELTKMNYRDFIDPQTVPSVLQIFNEIYRTGKQKTFITHELITKDNSKIIVEMSVSLLRDNTGEPLGFHGVARDVTEKIKAQLATREGEERYRLIAENMNDIILTINLDLQFIYVSPSSLRVAGWEVEDVLNISVKELITPSSFDRLEKILAEKLIQEATTEPLEREKYTTIEVEAYHKEGHTLWLEITTTFKRDNDGKILAIQAVGRDITERKKIIKDLEDSEKRFRMIVENMNDVISIMDLNFQLIYVSNTNLKLTGYTKEEVKEVPLDKLLTPASLEQVIRIFGEEYEREKNRTQFDEIVARTLELEFLHKEGGTTWAEVTASLSRDEQGNPISILLTTRDITERRKAEEALKESEKRYRLIVENMHDTIWIMDLNLQYKYLSQGSASITGFTGREMLAIPVKDQVTPESYAILGNILMEELAMEESGQSFDPKRIRTIEIEAYHKDGGTIWIELSTTFNRDGQGKPLEIVIAGRNITERKKMQAEKEKLEEQLLHAQKMESVGRLAGGVAHDFNNMLNVILGYAELAKMRMAQDNPLIHNITEIEKAASRSKEITSQLLAFSRKQIVVPKIINLNEQIANIEKTIVRLIGEDVRLFFHTQSDLWNIKIDPSQIEQILFNLIINARDAMQGGGKLTVETVNVQLDEGYSHTHADFEPGQYVLLTVSDNGHGIDKETLEHIFEPFFTTKETGKGTGLGLATVYGIVKQNGGFINVYSEPGQGTAFKIYFRRTEEATPLEKVEEESIPRASGTILLVEDDLPLRELTIEMLETIGYEVLTVENPREAVSLCERGDKEISLVLTDVVMPEMNGRELRDKLFLVRPDIKVLFMSGYTTDVIAHHGVLEKGVHFLQKPFSMKDLAHKISEVTAGK